jgi:hypothetical protein
MSNNFVGRRMNVSKGGIVDDIVILVRWSGYWFDFG